MWLPTDCNSLGYGRLSGKGMVTLISEKGIARGMLQAGTYA
jgi:hypothetical protein